MDRQLFKLAAKVPRATRLLLRLLVKQLATLDHRQLRMHRMLSKMNVRVLSYEINRQKRVEHRASREQEINGLVYRLVRQKVGQQIKAVHYELQDIRHNMKKLKLPRRKWLDQLTPQKDGGYHTKKRQYYSVTPQLAQYLFKLRRDKYQLRVDEAAKQSKISAATIARLENGYTRFTTGVTLKKLEKLYRTSLRPVKEISK